MRNTLLIKDLPDNTRPRERLVEKGCWSLSDVELLAIVLSTGGKDTSALQLANILIKKHDGMKNLLSLPHQTLMKEKYIGKAKAAVISAIFEISKRIINVTENKVQIKSPKDVYDKLINQIFGVKKEHLFLLTLDTRKLVIAIDTITVGTVNEALFPIREILIKALERNAVNIIIAHNHPSNDVTPSSEDIEVTQQLNKACRHIGISLLDHVIISEKNFYSLRSANLIDKERG